MLHIALAGLGFIDQVMPDAERAYAEGYKFDRERIEQLLDLLDDFCDSSIA
jgi:hypothetical protein